MRCTGDDGRVRLWDPYTGEQLPALEGHQGPVRAVYAVTAGGRQLLGSDGTVRLWDPSLNKFLPASNLKAGIHLKTPDGQTAVVVGVTIPKVHDGWMWDLSVPGNNDHDFYVLATGPFRMTDPAVLVHNIRCEALTVSYRRAFTRRIWTEIRSRSRTMSGVTCSMTPARRWDLT
jgi:WD domain, G-beta repeat